MPTIVCPNCGTESRDEELCPGCNVPLTVSCPECGTVNASDGEACTACGASLAHGVPDAPNA